MIDGSSTISSSSRKGLLILIAVMGGILLQLSVAWQLRGRIAAGFPDFSAFYTAGKIVANGDGSRLYEIATQARVEGTFTIRSDQRSFLSYYHAPFEALMFAPLALFSYQVAFWAWWGFNIALWITTLLLMRPHLPFLRGHFEFAVAASSFFFPLLLSECQGQDSTLTLFLFAVCYLGLRTHRPFLAGMALALAAYKPQLALPMLLVLVVASDQRRRILAGFASASLGLFLLTFIFLGARPIIGYPAFLFHASSASGDAQIHPETMANLRGLLLTALGNHVSPHVGTALVIAISGAIVMATTAIWRSRDTGYGNLARGNLRFALVVTATALISYHGHAHDMTMLLLPLLFVVDWLAGTHAVTWNQKFLGACSLLVFYLPGITWNPPFYSFIILLFFASLWLELRRSQGLVGDNYFFCSQAVPQSELTPRGSEDLC